MQKIYQENLYPVVLNCDKVAENKMITKSQNIKASNASVKVSTTGVFNVNK